MIYNSQTKHSIANGASATHSQRSVRHTTMLPTLPTVYTLIAHSNTHTHSTPLGKPPAILTGPNQDLWKDHHACKKEDENEYQVTKSSNIYLRLRK